MVFVSVNGSKVQGPGSWIKALEAETPGYVQAVLRPVAIVVAEYLGELLCRVAHHRNLTCPR